METGLRPIDDFSEPDDFPDPEEPTNPPPQPPPAVPVDAVPVDREMIARFAPEVRLHPDDAFRPASVSWFLPGVQMKMDVRGGLFGASDPVILGPGQVTPENIAAQFSREQHSGAGYPSDFYLQIAGGNEDATRRGDLGSAVCYVHTVDSADDPGSTDIQYWFFFPYNGDITGRGRAGITILLNLLNPVLGTVGAAVAIATRIEHEGDWEHVTVRVGADGQPRQAYYSAHKNEGGWYGFDTLLRVDTHAVVYSARHSHASYARPGEQSRPDLLDLIAPDVTGDGGPVWRTWENFEWLNQTNPGWLAYSGLWGQTGIFEYTTGPRAPAFQESWNGDGGVRPVGALVFREDNDCGGDIVGQTTDAPGQAIDLTSRPGWTNDEARSVRLERVRAGTVITVYDNSDGEADDDWTRILVRRDGSYCVGTFEQQRDDPLLRIAHHYVSNLDGKVSRITVDHWPNLAGPRLPVRYGSKIKLLHYATAQALHSHPFDYGHPGTSGQQQVTGFGGGDDNDLWILKGPHGQPENYRRGEAVQHGEIVRLEHAPTGRNLHSHQYPSPVTGQQEVTCYGEGGIGDDNDNWRVEVEDGGVWESGKRLRLIHGSTDCALHSHAGFFHPEWTRGQQEVTGFSGRDDNDWWTLLEFREQLL